MDENKALVVFQNKKIRRIWHNNEWFFSVVDIVEALTESKDPGITGKSLNTGWLRKEARWLQNVTN